MSDNQFVNKPRGRRSQRSMGSIAITVLVAIVLWYFNGGLDNLLNQSGDTAQTQQESRSTGGLAEANSSQQSGPSNGNANAPAGMPVVPINTLPPEAVETINLVWSNGPFPFDKDDTTFGNREGLLPDESRGYYREYTVVTPGLSHRGARRIVGGADGELYYTDDHYESFSWVNTE